MPDLVFQFAQMFQFICCFDFVQQQICFAFVLQSKLVSCCFEKETVRIEHKIQLVVLVILLLFIVLFCLKRMTDNSTNFDNIDFGGGINGNDGGGDNNINFFGANTKQKKRNGDKFVQNKKQKKQNKKHRRKKNKEKAQLQHQQQQQQQNKHMMDNMHNNRINSFKFVRNISQIEQSVISKQ